MSAFMHVLTSEFAHGPASAGDEISCAAKISVAGDSVEKSAIVRVLRMGPHRITCSVALRVEQGDGPKFCAEARGRGWYKAAMVLLSERSPLVLGSGSPRRREILESLRVAHVVFAAAADESVTHGEAPDAYLERVVLAKLVAVRAGLPEDLAARCGAVLVADTSVIDGATILGKPAGTGEAEAMIARLAGRVHEVRTRFVVADGRHGAPLHAETVTTRVTFRPLAASEIEAYAASGEGFDKAGAYAVQGLGASIVSRIEGSYSNVVGLPACELVVALRGAGLL